MTPARVIAAIAIGLLVTAALLTDMWFRLTLAVTGLCFVMFALAHPRPALFLWLLLAPVANVYARLSLPVGLPDLTFGRVVITLVVAGILLRLVLKGRRIVPFGGVELAMVALVAIMGLDLLMRSRDPTSDALQNFDERLTPILLFLAARNLCVFRADLKAAARILMVVGCYLAVHGSIQYLDLGTANPTTSATVDRTQVEGGMRVNESHLSEGRAVGPFESAVEYGSVAGITLLATLYVALYLTDGVARWLTLAALPLIGAAVVFSSTRSTWVGAYVGLLLMAALDRRLRLRMLTVVGTITAAAVVAGIILIPQSSTLRERASSTEPIEGRLLMYEVGLRIAARHPLIGYGRGAPSRIAARQELYALGSPDADLAPGQFHDVFLMTLVEWGIGGMLAYIAMLGLMLKGALDLRRRLAGRQDFVYHFGALFLGTAVVFIAQGLLVDTPPFFYLNGVFFFLGGLVHAQLDATAAEQTAAEPAYAAVSLLRTGGSARA